MVLIDKDSLIEHMRKAYKGNIKNGFKWDLVSAVAVIGAEEEITPDAEPIRHGHWKEVHNDYDDVYYECSACGAPWMLLDGTPSDNNMNYCLNCGALMDGEVEE